MAARRLTALAEAAVPYLARAPDAPRLLAHLVQVVGELSLVVTQAELASRDREIGELQKEVADLRSLLDVKSSLVSLATHELRRPLGVAAGYLSMLQDGDLGPVAPGMREPIGAVAEAARSMQRLLEELALAERLEDQAEVLRLQPMAVEEVIDHAITSTGQEASAKTVGIIKRVEEPGIEAPIDRERLGLAIVNLLGNAVKYSPPGSRVEVAVERQGAQVMIRVADQGPGILADEQPRVFERHYRSPREEQGGVSGLGLGLYLVKQIVELHGGAVTLDSEPWQGATFTIRLPAQPDCT